MNIDDPAITETLSSFWRNRRSSDRAIELRDLQESLAFLAKTILGDRAVDVAWSHGLSDPNSLMRNRVILDSTPVDDIPDGATIPDERVDVLMGDLLFKSHLERTRGSYLFDAVRGWNYSNHDGTAWRPASMDRYISTIKKGRVRPVQVLEKRANPLADIPENIALSMNPVQIASVIEHLRTYHVASVAPPAVGQYVNKSRDWKRARVQPVIDALTARCSQTRVTIKDALDFWSMFIMYGLTLSENLNEDLVQAMLQATPRAFEFVNNASPTDIEARQILADIANAFGKLVQQPEPEPEEPEPESGGDSEPEGEQGDNTDTEQGSGQSSPDGTDKKNEGEPPQGGPGNESGDSEKDESDLPEDGDTEGDDDTDGTGDTGGADNQGDEDSPQPSDASESTNSESPDPESDALEEPESTETGRLDADEGDDDDQDDQDDDWDGFDGDDEGESEDSPPEPEAKQDDLLDKVDKNSKSQPLVDSLDNMSELSKRDIAKIQEATESQREDLSDDVAEYCEGAGYGGPNIIWEKAKHDPRLERELRIEGYKSASGITQILRQFNRMANRYEHGRVDGNKLDSRRVGRIMYGNDHVFKQRTIIDKLDMALILLADCSGSVSDKDYGLMLEAIAGFVQAVGNRTDCETIAMAYTSMGHANTVLFRIFDKIMGTINAVRTGSGGTPSGYALMATREGVLKRLGRQRRDRIVIHLTDGQPDDPGRVKQEVEANRVAKIETYCILIGARYMKDQLFVDCYGKNFIRLNSYKDLLPRLIELFGKVTQERIS